MVVIFDRPLHLIARQPILAAQRDCASVFQPAESSVGRRPQDSLSVDAQVADRTFAKALGGRVGGTNLAILPIRHASLVKPQPDATLQGIDGQSHSEFFMPKLAPRNLP